MRFCLLLLLLPSFAFAESLSERAAICAKEEGALDRLGCFDLISEEFGLNQKKNRAVVKAGDWRTSQATSEMDDITRYYLSLDAVSDVSIGVYREVRPRLYIACSGASPNVFISWDYYLSVGSVDANFRFDKKRVYKSSWDTIGDKKTMVFPRAGTIFIKRLLEHDRLLVEVEPFSELPVVAEFRIAGLSGYLPAFRKKCGF